MTRRPPRLPEYRRRSHRRMTTTPNLIPNPGRRECATPQMAKHPAPRRIDQTPTRDHCLGGIPGRRRLTLLLSARRAGLGLVAALDPSDRREGSAHGSSDPALAISR